MTRQLIDPLMQPFELKNLTLRNRVVSTSHEPSYTEDGMPISQRRPPTETKKSKESAKPGKTRDESTGVYRELDALLGLVVTDVEKR